jgi:hypothetical protein
MLENERDINVSNNFPAHYGVYHLFILLRAWRASSGSLRSSPAALLATNASSANADAEEATPAPGGKLFSLVTSGVLLYAPKLV